jgi:hypothetical protein
MIVLLVRDELSSVFERWRLVLGLFFIAAIYLFPDGLVGSGRRAIKVLLSRPRHGHASSAAPPATLASQHE